MLLVSWFSLELGGDRDYPCTVGKARHLLPSRLNENRLGVRFSPLAHLVRRNEASGSRHERWQRQQRPRPQADRFREVLPNQGSRYHDPSVGGGQIRPRLIPHSADREEYRYREA